jgi:predicted transcriptional regulator
LGNRKATPAHETDTARKGTAAGKADDLRNAVSRLVDNLPEEKLEFARRYLEHLSLESDDDEILTPEEQAHIDEGLADLAAGRVVSDEEMRREFGW